MRLFNLMGSGSIRADLRFLPPALHLDPVRNPARSTPVVASRQPDYHELNTKAGFINSMSYTNDHQPESPSEDLFGEVI